MSPAYAPFSFILLHFQQRYQPLIRIYNGYGTTPDTVLKIDYFPGSGGYCMFEAP